MYVTAGLLRYKEGPWAYTAWAKEAITPGKQRNSFFTSKRIYGGVPFLYMSQSRETNAVLEFFPSIGSSEI